MSDFPLYIENKWITFMVIFFYFRTFLALFWFSSHESSFSCYNGCKNSFQGEEDGIDKDANCWF